MISHLKRLFLAFPLLLAGGVASAQVPPTTDSGLTGVWTGSIQIHLSGSHTENAVAWLYLRQHGAQFSGSIGADQNKQSPLRRPVYKDGHIRFAIESVGHKPMSFDLRLDQGKLVGDAEGDFGAANARADLSLERSQSHVLYEEIAHMDDVMFDAFNAHDLETLKGLFTEDLEFYHDKDGLTNYTQNMEAFKEHFAGKTRIRRELDEATLEVYPLKDFGAIEVGVHRFYTTEPGETEKLTATAKFVHVWTKKDGMWKVKRVVSYDHE